MLSRAHARLVVASLLCVVVMVWAPTVVRAEPASSEGSRPHLHRAAIFLKAGDYRQAVEACQAEVREAPSVRSYLFLTYVYHALEGYLEHVAATDQWVKVEQLYFNLTSGRVEDLADPPEVLPRIAKEMIQQGVQRQSDLSAAMAARLDTAAVAQLWPQQAAWRKARPQDWWAAPPPEWRWTP